jgi:hypothetical protein
MVPVRFRSTSRYTVHCTLYSTNTNTTSYVIESANHPSAFIACESAWIEYAAQKAKAQGNKLTRTIMMRQQCLLLTALVAFQFLVEVDGFQALSAPPKSVHEMTASKNSSGGESSRRKFELPPVIQQIADERADFQINLGRAMDTLRRDMPNILSRTPG